VPPAPVWTIHATKLPFLNSSPLEVKERFRLSSRGAGLDAEIAGKALAMLEQMEASADSGALQNSHIPSTLASVPFMALSPGTKIGSHRGPRVPRLLRNGRSTWHTVRV
jgi:hypothetical protein